MSEYSRANERRIMADTPIGITYQTTDHNRADIVFRNIMEQIQKFESQLEPSQGMQFILMGLGQSVSVSVEHIEFKNPNLVFFFGKLNNQKVQLIQHVSQLNFLLVAVSTEDVPVKERRPIGFSLPTED